MSTDQEQATEKSTSQASDPFRAASSDDPTPKRAKKAVPLPASVVVQFQSSAGEVTGPQIDLPTDSTPAQLELLINELRTQNEGKVGR